MSWTCIRGTSADGAVEWEERWWKTSDSFTYRELGAVKSGRDSNGQAWQESWKEMYVHEVNKIPYIHREASKWSHTPEGRGVERRVDGGLPRRWHRRSFLRENRRARGRRRSRGRPRKPVDGKVGREVGRSRRVHQVDGHVGVEGSLGGRHGERARAVVGREMGGKVGRRVQRARPRGGRGRALHGTRPWASTRSRVGARSTTPDGRLHKYGNSSDGSQYWDTWEDGAGGWWERNPSFGWIEALHHSPDLMNLPLQPRTGGGTGPAKGPNGRKIITPHRSRRGASGGGRGGEAGSASASAAAEGGHASASAAAAADVTTTDGDGVIDSIRFKLNHSITRQQRLHNTHTRRATINAASDATLAASSPRASRPSSPATSRTASSLACPRTTRTRTFR